MKRTIRMASLALAVIGLALASVISVQAQTNSLPWWQDWIQFNTGVNAAQSITFAAYPGYAPGLTVDGKKQEWGAGIALLYPLSPNIVVGGRLDWLAEQFWAPSVNIGVQTDVRLFNRFTVTPFVLGGGIWPLSGTGGEPREVGAIVGTGLYTTLWSSKNADGKEKFNLKAFYAAEYWTTFDGILIHRPGAALTWKF